MPQISAQCKGCPIALKLLKEYTAASTQESTAMGAELLARTQAQSASPNEKEALNEVATVASSALKKLTEARTIAEGGLNGTAICPGFQNGQCGSA